jgi:hypothetical protein
MKQKLLITTLLVIGIVLVINFLSNEVHLRLGTFFKIFFSLF